MKNEESGKRHVIVLVHGIRTFGSWQERLLRMLREEDPNVEVYIYKYGYFSALAFLLPFFRIFPIRGFRKYLLSSKDDWENANVDIVAHSFGTFIVGQALRGMHDGDSPRFRLVLLCGSVLKQLFPWHSIVGQKKQVARIINDCGQTDIWPVFAQLFVLGMGIAGRRGFAGVLGPDAGVINRFYPVGHSGFFEEFFMETNWLPVLTSDELELTEEIVPPHPGWSVSLEYYLEPVKLIILVSPIILVLSVWSAQQKQIAKEQALVSISHANRILYRDPIQAFLNAREATEYSDDEEISLQAELASAAAVQVISMRAKLFQEDVENTGLGGFGNFVTPMWFKGKVLASWSPNGRYALFSTKRGETGNNPPGEVYLLDSETMRLTELISLRQPGSIVRRLEYSGFSRSGHRIYVSRQFNIEVYGAGGQYIEEHRTGGGCTKVPIHLVVEGLHKDTLLYADAEGYLWELQLNSAERKSKRCTRILGRYLNPVVVSTQTGGLASAMAVTRSDGTGVILVAGNGNSQYGTIDLPHNELTATSLASTQGDTILFTSSSSHGSTLWRLDAGKKELVIVQKFEHLVTPIIHAAFSSDGKELVTVDSKNKVRLQIVPSKDSHTEN